MKFRRLLALTLCLLMTALAVGACGNTADPAATSDNAAATTAPEAPEESTEEYISDNLPDTLNYNNQDFVIFTWNNQTSWEWTDSDETTGDIIKDAIFKRQIDTEERLGITIVIQGQAGEWENRNSFIDSVYNSLSAGADDAYDLIGQYTPASAIGIVRGCYCNLNNIKYLDLEKPWWPSDIIQSGEILGKIYAVAGDISCTLIRNMVCIETNLSMAEDLKLGNFYDMVKNHEWTGEKFMTLATGTVTGLNADGTPCYSTTIPSNVAYDNVFYSGGFHFCDHDDENGLVIAEALSSPRINDWFDMWSDFWAKDDVGTLGIDGVNGFTSGNVLFHFGQISDVQNNLQEIDFDFGILPYPMIDKDQDNYRTICGYWVSMYSIPVNAADKDMSGAVLECLGSYGYRIITPAVYNVSFQYRFLNSQDNADIFNLLHDTLVFDIGRTMGDQVNCFAAFRQAAGQSDSWAAYFKAQESVWKKNIKNVVKAVTKLDD